MTAMKEKSRNKFPWSGEEIVRRAKSVFLSEKKARVWFLLFSGVLLFIRVVGFFFLFNCVGGNFSATTLQRMGTYNRQLFILLLLICARHLLNMRILVVQDDPLYLPSGTLVVLVLLE